MAQHLIATYGYAAVFLLIAGESLGLPLPGELTLLLAASYAASGRLQIGWVIGAAIIGTLAGSIAAYVIGRSAGRRILQRWGRYIFLDEAKLARAEAFVARYGDKAIFLARFITFLREIAGLLAGINRMPLGRFLLFNSLGGIVWAVLYGLLAYKLGAAVLSGASRDIGIGAVIVIVVVALLLIIFRRRARLLLHRMQGRNDATESTGSSSAAMAGIPEADPHSGMEAGWHSGVETDLPSDGGRDRGA
ncbi:MAG TPA: DedA family protein [Chloroflexota bacterium]|nr:DedA family protein [Chloroflexota bacterium]